jgi:hypothetical protein
MASGTISLAMVNKISNFGTQRIRHPYGKATSCDRN